MITDAIMTAFSTAIGWVFAAIQVPAPPGWISTTITGAASAFGHIGSFSYWIPTGVLPQAMIAVLACMFMGAGIRAVRMVVSIATGGGGSAG